MSLFAELKRRNVFKVGILYLASSWVILQVADLLLGALGLPEGWLRLILALLVGGFPLVIIFTWIYEAPPEGIRGLLPFLVKSSESVSLPQFEAISSTCNGTETGQTPAGQSVSIAVLPFANMSGEPAQDYFADGIAEEILNTLSRISGLQVRGRTSSFYFKGRQEDLKSIATQLNVDHILEGSVRKSGDKVRITVQLIHVPTDSHLWSKSYDRVLEDIFAIQEDIATSVTTALEVSLGIGELGTDAGMTRNVQAYELYLESREQWNYFDRSHALRAIELMEHAVKIDPDFGLAWGKLSGEYLFAARYFVTEQEDFYLKRMDTARARSLELAPNSRVTLMIRAEMAQSQGEWQLAEGVIEQLLDLAHDDYENYWNAGFFEFRVGRPRAAQPYFEAAARVEPLNRIPVALIGNMHALLDSDQEAHAAFKRARSLPIGNLAIVISGELLLAMARRQTMQIAQLLEQFSQLSFNNRIGKLASGLYSAIAQSLDSPENGLETVRRFAADSQYRAGASFSSNLAYWAAFFGDPQFALDLHYRDSKPAVGELSSLWIPLFKEMRRLPGFKQLVIDLGLVDYWRATDNWGDFCKPIGENDFECY